MANIQSVLSRYCTSFHETIYKGTNTCVLPCLDTWRKKVHLKLLWTVKMPGLFEETARRLLFPRNRSWCRFSETDLRSRWLLRRYSTQSWRVTLGTAWKKRRSLGGVVSKKSWVGIDVWREKQKVWSKFDRRKEWLLPILCIPDTAAFWSKRQKRRKKMEKKPEVSQRRQHPLRHQLSRWSWAGERQAWREHN